jgi:hypothetical protein
MPIDKPYVCAAFNAAHVISLTPAARVAQVLANQLHDAASAFATLDPDRTQTLLSSFGPIRQPFALKRHLLCASLYRKQLGERFCRMVPLY